MLLWLTRARYSPFLWEDFAVFSSPLHWFIFPWVHLSHFQFSSAVENHNDSNPNTEISLNWIECLAIKFNRGDYEEYWKIVAHVHFHYSIESNKREERDNFNKKNKRCSDFINFLLNILISHKNKIIEKNAFAQHKNKTHKSIIICSNATSFYGLNFTAIVSSKRHQWLRSAAPAQRFQHFQRLQFAERCEEDENERNVNKTCQYSIGIDVIWMK